MARVWNNVTNLELLKNRTILQLLKNQDDLLKEFALEIDRIEGVANTAVGTANNALSVATTARAESTAALQTAQAANAKSDEAKADAADAKTAAEKAANAAVAAQGSAAAAENSAGQAANSAAAAAADAASAKATAENAAAGTSQNTTSINQLDSRVGGLETNYTALQGRVNSAEATLQRHSADIASLESSQEEQDGNISQLESQVTTAQQGVNQINARESGYGKSLSINGNSLSLMHDANTLSTVTIPGGGGSTGLPAPVEMTGWSTTSSQADIGRASLTGCYSIKLNQKSYLIYGGRLSGGLLNGSQSVTIIPPDELGNVSFAAGWVQSAMPLTSGQNLQITANALGVVGQLRVIASTASQGGMTNYNNELLDGFMAIVTFM